MSDPFDDGGKWRESENARLAAEAEAANENERGPMSEEPSLELTEEEQGWLARRDYRYFGDSKTRLDALTRLEDFFLRTLARAMRAEFERDHVGCGCGISQIKWEADPRHNWTPRDWFRSAERIVMGEPNDQS